MNKLFFIILGFLLTNVSFSQELNSQLISSSGKSFKNTNFQLDWSIGETVTETYSSVTNVITQGFHQNTYSISKVEDLLDGIDINVYPNPTQNFVFINLNQNENKVDVIVLTDIQGKIIQNKKVTKDIEKIEFSNYPRGIYFLKISQTNKSYKEFKIIKK